MTSERIQKILSNAGVTSRRKAEELISLGLVTINGKLAQLGDQAQWGKDSIKVKGKLLTQKPSLSRVYLALNKPRRVLCDLHSDDTQERKTLASLLKPLKSHVYPIEPLDFHSEGLVILTNDGEFAQKLRKSDQITRVYRIKVKGHFTDLDLRKLLKPYRVFGKLVVPVYVKNIEKYQQKSLLEIALKGPAFIDLKTLLMRKGFLVEHIKCTKIGTISLKNLLPGQYQFIKKGLISSFFKLT